MSTKTNFVGTFTVYAACLSTANFANQATGLPLVELISLPETRALSGVSFQTDNVFSCCDAAFAGQTAIVAAAQMFAFDRREDPDDSTKIIGICTTLGSDTCGANQAANSFEVLNEEQAAGEEPTQEFPGIVELPIFGNGACGLGVGPQ